MPVIAITRELGCLGNDVAVGLAKDLGLRLVKHEMVERLARKTKLPGSAVLRCIEGRATLYERLRADLRSLSLYAEEEIFDLAAADNVVIRGWGATHLLRSVPHVLCVRICAPVELRARRVMELFGLEDVTQARAEVRRSDAERNGAMQRRFGPGWDQAPRHDIVFNTEFMGAERCIAQIKRALEFPEYQPTADSRARILGLALATRIRATLRRERATSDFRVSVEANLNGHPGRVTLYGIVLDENDRRAAEDVVMRCPGVRGVENLLRTMWPRFVQKSHDG